MLSSQPARIFHTRLKDFPIHAERLQDASLESRALAVVSSPRQNGTILALSREAEQEGLRRQMRVSLARKISPRTVLVTANPALYHKVQTLLYQRLTRYSPAVEAAGYGRFFMDMTGTEGLFSSSERAGHMVRRDLADQLNLTARIGIGCNKLVAAIATQVPTEAAVLTVPPGGELHFLAPLHASILPIAREPRVLQPLRDLNLAVVRDVQELVSHTPLGQMVFNPFFKQVSAQARGVDTSLVLSPQWTHRNGRNLLERYTLPEETNDAARLRGGIQYLADVVAYKLRRLQCRAEDVTLTLHYSDGYEDRASGRLPRPDTAGVTAGLLGLFRRANRRRNRVRAMTVAVRRLKPYARQLSLFAGGDTRDQRVARQVDRIREKYGVGSILTAGQLCLED